MKCNLLYLRLLFALFFFMGLNTFGQLQKVIIEKYYLSDSNDATDTSGGVLPAGSITYRIYVDMYPNSKLKKIYGNDNHPFIIKSTAPFFNHATDGQTFAKDFVKARYSENIVALDSWLTLGQTSKTQGGKTFFGILKNQDRDGSFIGGANNDGGSAMLSGGLLVNNDTSCGRPLTVADGMDTMITIPTTWFSAGVKNFVTGADSTIFGSIISGKEFNSRLFELRNSGTSGVVVDSNQVLIAQLTTSGELSFNLNMEIEFLQNGVPTTTKYVGTDSILLSDETYHPFLIYPLECGCSDPAYLEYDPRVACLVPGSCVTPIAVGCMDAMACNFDPNANFNVEGLCCYPGNCSGRDIAQVCPSQMGDDFDFTVYPNPSSTDFFLDVFSGMKDYSIKYSLLNTYGLVIAERVLDATDIIVGEKISMDGRENGIYYLKVEINGQSKSELLIKSN